MRRPVIPLDRITAVIFATDGVVTDTDRLHAASWKAVFDPFLRSFAAGRRERVRPFDMRNDYLDYLDGRPRLDGVRDFLTSRAIRLTFDDIRGIAARKDELFLEQIRRYGVTPFASTITLVRRLRQRGVLTAAVSAGHDCAEVLIRSGVARLFDVHVDGSSIALLRAPGRPRPDPYLEAAVRLYVAPERAAVVEDAVNGVATAHRDGFAMVIGVARNRDTAHGAQALLEHGADVAVADLGEVELSGGLRAPMAFEL